MCFADILRKVKGSPELKTVGDDVHSIRKTQKGELLLEFKRSTEATMVYQANIKTILPEEIEVKTLTEEVTLELRYLDEITTKEEIITAWKEQIGAIQPSAIKTIRSAPGGTRTAIIQMQQGIDMDVCCYLPPSLSIEEFKQRLDDIVKDAKSIKPILIAGDFNAWAFEWGSTLTNPRGECLLEALATLDVVLLNCGQKDTFSRNGRSSKIDLTFISDPLANSTDWQVSDIYTHSDHQATVFEIHERSTRAIPAATTSNLRWKELTLDKEAFKLLMDDIHLTGSANDKAIKLMRCITNACNASMAKKGRRNGRQHVYWWTDQISELRRKCKHARRLCQRARGRGNFIAHQEAYKISRNELKKAIANSKTRCYREMCDEVENNPWGLGYKVVMKKLYSYRPPVTIDAVKLQAIVEGLFPQRAEIIYTVQDSEPQNEIPEGNNAQDASGYRPLCMIDTTGKLLEKIISRRLEEALNGSGLSDRQFGFRKAYSTIDAVEAVIAIAKDAIKGIRWLEGDKEYCAIITLDVKNAFNSAAWDTILAALHGKNVPKCYVKSEWKICLKRHAQAIV
ncbi:uncharacterized protein LOC119674048 [Teleopsis dalmanni]|uniref:uncharacterized protein LOC119674048 n=1 Tax=Teleopsis dalmanni TaxID=139649 RepID=UPI0018CCE85D|nr:uncharacterized protein LOC119674048 [Teleopsis dalmanni]